MKISREIRQIFNKSKKPKDDMESLKHVLNDKSDFVKIETFKSIRTNILFSMPKSDKGRIVTITSSAPGEGKTTTSINLAITFAQMGARVLLVDCDMRKARIHRYLQIERVEGITNVLCGFTDFENAVKKNVRENLDVLTCGEIPPNPAELLENEEFEKLLNTVKEQYDYIFIDTPPITVVTDAAVVMKHANGAVVVIRENVTSYDFLDTAMSDVKKTGVNILGVIVLGQEEKTKKSRYYKSYKYRKYKQGYDYAGYLDNPADSK
ncbi:MAG: CpsD/CapB family tyrosine-protein kinase [Clostridia bacterium]|nr:CpsD/CapB family tyrosine-protein kinase [Clostridia bacterium]